MSFTWGLNPLTWDVLINRSGKVQITYGKQEVKQRIEVTLNHHFGEYFLNVQHGMPWYVTSANRWAILGSKNYKTVEMLTRSAVLDVPGVVSLVSMDISLPRASNYRAMSIRMQVEVQGQDGPSLIDVVYALRVPEPLYPYGMLVFGDSPVVMDGSVIVFGEEP